MRNVVINKLIRDKIPEISKNAGNIPYTRILNDEEYKKELENKLLEEINEFLNSKTKEERIEELADTLEVIRSLATLEDTSFEELINVMEEKREKRGGFTKKLFLESFDTDKESW